MWPDWAIYWTFGNDSKPLATINLPKSFLGNFYRHLAIFIWSHCSCSSYQSGTYDFTIGNAANRWYLASLLHCANKMRRQKMSSQNNCQNVEQNVYVFVCVLRWVRICSRRSVWPDLAKFRQFGKHFNIFGNLLRVHSEIDKSLSLIWDIFLLLGKISML